MILGIGTDIVSLNRIADTIETSGNLFLDKIFTKREQEQARLHHRPTAYYASLFAGKEAIFKLFRIGWETGVELNQIEIRNGPNGEPIPELSGRFAEIAHERGVTEIFVSLSYEDEFAVGIAAMQ